LAKSLVQELKTTNVTELTELWKRSGVIEEANDDGTANAPFRVSLPDTSSYEAMIVFLGILCKTKGVLVVKSAVYPDLDRNSQWQRGFRLCWGDREEGADGGGAKSSAHSLLEWSSAIICYNFPTKIARFRGLIPQQGPMISKAYAD